MCEGSCNLTQRIIIRPNSTEHIIRISSIQKRISRIKLLPRTPGPCLTSYIIKKLIRHNVFYRKIVRVLFIIAWTCPAPGAAIILARAAVTVLATAQIRWTMTGVWPRWRRRRIRMRRRRRFVVVTRPFLAASATIGRTGATIAKFTATLVCSAATVLAQYTCWHNSNKNHNKKNIF